MQSCRFESSWRNMNLYLTNILMPLLFLSVEADSPLGERYPQASEVYHCIFDSSSDPNFDAWPDGWTRRRGQGYPSYVNIQIQAGAAPGGAQCLRVDLDGGGGGGFHPPL